MSELSPNSLRITDLPPFEKNEIGSYLDNGIYYVPTDATKIAANVTSNCNDYSIFDSENGHYRVVVSDHLMYRYEILQLLGAGTFGQVVMSFDHKERKKVAVKILKSKKHKMSISERITYNYMHTRLGNNTDELCSMVDHFYFRNHACIVFKLYGKNLYDILKMNKFKPIQIYKVKQIVRSILNGLSKLHSINVFHGDMKLDNIVLRDDNTSEATIVDLGCSKFGYYNAIGHRQCDKLRSPEYLLGLSCGPPSDIWSLGILAWQLATASNIFENGENMFDQMTLIMEVLGTPPKSLLNESPLKDAYFYANSIYPKYCSVKIGSRYKIMKTGRSPSGKTRYLPRTRRVFGEVEKCFPDFYDFLRKCLQWNPVNRLTAASGLYHRWVREETLSNVTGINPVKIGSSVSHHSSINVNFKTTPGLNRFNGKLLKSTSLINCRAGLKCDNNTAWLNSKAEHLLEIFRRCKARTKRCQRHDKNLPKM